MKTTKIYLAHALTQAPVEFADRMKGLRQQLRNRPGIHVIDFAWEFGKEFNERVNVYEYDMNCVREADLVIAMLDHFSSGTAMEIQARCQMIGAPLTCFYVKGTLVSKIIRDCIHHYRDALTHDGRDDLLWTLPDPIQYSDDNKILDYAVDWLEKHCVVSAA